MYNTNEGTHRVEMRIACSFRSQSYGVQHGRIATPWAFPSSAPKGNKKDVWAFKCAEEATREDILGLQVVLYVTQEVPSRGLICLHKSDGRTSTNPNLRAVAYTNRTCGPKPTQTGI